MRSHMRLLLCLACLACLSSTYAEVGSSRELLQKRKKELADKEREEDALEAYFIQQATLNKEQESMLRFAEEEAVSIVKKIDRAVRKKQVAILADLWENAKGTTIVKSLAALLDLNPKKATYYYGVNSDAMEQAEGNGYGFKVSEGLYNAMAVTDSSADHFHLLDALLYRKGQKEKEGKGAGCKYIGYLFGDAESWAIEDGRAQHFFRGFANEDYLSITECFLTPCKGSAAKCCADKRAVSTGLCSCKVIDKKEGTKQCEHNLFSTAPRIIWLCGTSDCQPDEKCLCPEQKGSKKKTKESSNKSTKSSKKGKTVEEETKSKGTSEKKTTKSSDKNEKARGKAIVSEKSDKISLKGSAKSTRSASKREKSKGKIST